MRKTGLNTRSRKESCYAETKNKMCHFSQEEDPLNGKPPHPKASKVRDKAHFFIKYSLQYTLVMQAKFIFHQRPDTCIILVS